MSRKVLNGNIGSADIDTIMDSIIAQNPQLNYQIEKVRNESNVFVCEVLRIYPFEDKAYVRILENNKKVFCKLSHEILSEEMVIDYLPNGIEKKDKKKYVGKKYIQPFDTLYGIIIKVRWENLKDENVLLGYINFKDNYALKSSSDKGEIAIKCGSSTISVENERINIMTPSLFVNGLPYDAPELKNYYDKLESNIITNSLNNSIQKNEVKVDNKLDENSENPVANKVLFDAINEIQKRLSILELKTKENEDN